MPMIATSQTALTSLGSGPAFSIPRLSAIHRAGNRRRHTARK
jgi:hypothetical protein